MGGYVNVEGKFLFKMETTQTVNTVPKRMNGGTTDSVRASN